MTDMIVGSIHNTNKNGKLKIIKYKGSLNVIVEFIATGTQVKTQAVFIRQGIVKDYNYKSIVGVGFIGVGRYKATEKGIATKAYTTWNCMLTRCYSEAARARYNTYTDCSVDPDWHNFQKFAEWFYKNKPDGNGWELDKDIKIKGNRIYSKDTCSFVTKRENINERNRSFYRMVSPKGDIVDIENMTLFCKTNSLVNSCMSKVNSGKRKSHKGWTRFK